MKNFIRRPVAVTSLFLAALSLNLSSAAAAELSGVKLPDRLNVSNQALVLNGIGVRTYLFTSVYVAGLYLVKPAKSEDEILSRVGDSKEPVAVVMHFKRDVSEPDMRDAWRHYLEKNSTGPWSELKSLAEVYLKTIPAVHAGDVLTHSFPPGKMTISLNDKEIGVYADSRLARTVLATWIGKNPTTEDLKRSLLGRR